MQTSPHLEHAEYPGHLGDTQILNTVELQILTNKIFRKDGYYETIINPGNGASSSTSRPEDGDIVDLIHATTVPSILSPVSISKTYCKSLRDYGFRVLCGTLIRRQINLVPLLCSNSCILRKHCFGVAARFSGMGNFKYPIPDRSLRTARKVTPYEGHRPSWKKVYVLERR